jgi:hypothetical protein
METRGSAPYSQESSTGPYSEPEASIHFLTLFPYDPMSRVRKSQIKGNLEWCVLTPYLVQRAKLAEDLAHIIW